MSWWEKGACRNLTNEQHDAWFFPARGGLTEQAAAICARCPVKAECLDHAITNQEMFGTWGGVSENERQRMRVAQGTTKRALKPIEHGTFAGFKAHLRRDEKPCQRCLIAKQFYESERKRIRGRS